MVLTIRHRYINIFVYKSFCIILEYQDNDDDDLKRFLDLKLTPAHNNRTLNKIGGELLLFFVMNDNHEKIADLKSNFSYGSIFKLLEWNVLL